MPVRYECLTILSFIWCIAFFSLFFSCYVYLCCGISIIKHMKCERGIRKKCAGLLALSLKKQKQICAQHKKRKEEKDMCQSHFPFIDSNLHRLDGCASYYDPALLKRPLICVISHSSRLRCNVADKFGHVVAFIVIHLSQPILWKKKNRILALTLKHKQNHQFS